MRGDEWECGVCGKHFVNEFYLDSHFQNKHQDKLRISKNKIPSADKLVHDEKIGDHIGLSSCLSEFCPMVGCSLYEMNEREVLFE